jgi:hypothetical protein
MKTVQSSPFYNPPFTTRASFSARTAALCTGVHNPGHFFGESHHENRTEYINTKVK